jgi:glutamine synthetase
MADRGIPRSVGALRRGMKGAGLPVEFSKGEAWHGQHELNFRFANAVTMADGTSSTRTARRRSRTSRARP